MKSKKYLLMYVGSQTAFRLLSNVKENYVRKLPRSHFSDDHVVKIVRFSLKYYCLATFVFQRRVLLSMKCVQRRENSSRTLKA